MQAMFEAEELQLELGASSQEESLSPGLLRETLLSCLAQAPKGLTQRQIASRMEQSGSRVKAILEELVKAGALIEGVEEKGNRQAVIYALPGRSGGTKAEGSAHLGGITALTEEILAVTEELYGPSAPDKVLYKLLTDRALSWRADCEENDLALRLEWLALRMKRMGYSVELIRGEDGSVLGLRQHASPFERLRERHPLLRRLEHNFLTTFFGSECDLLAEDSGDGFEFYLTEGSGGRQENASDGRTGEGDSPVSD